MSKGFITGTNEELIKAYKESRDESYLKELIEANKGLINLLVSPYLTSIPNSELEDLTSESYGLYIILIENGQKKEYFVCMSRMLEWQAFMIRRVCFLDYIPNIKRVFYR